MSGVRPVDLNQPLFSSGEFSPEGEALNNNTLKTRQHPFLSLFIPQNTTLAHYQPKVV